jgi:hypothetical protein
VSWTARKVLRRAVVAGLLLSFVTPVSAGTYRYITQTEDDAVFLDEESIHQSSNSISYWIIQAAPVPTEKYSYFLMRQTIRCAERRIRPTDMSVYNAAGARIASDAAGGDEGNIEPGTIDHILYMALCRNGLDTHPLLTASSPFELVTQWRAEMRSDGGISQLD